MIVTLAGVAGIELLVAPLLALDRWRNPTASAGGAIPAHCVEHKPFGTGVDFAGDYHCAGLAIDYHVGGVGRSSGKIWAGQWLFSDESGNFRLGMCTFNRGIHPRADVPAVQVAQFFPNDPSGAKRAYLTWRYGDTTDNLVAASLWAVFHYYAQDAAGTNRASNPNAALVASLNRISESSGRQDVEDLAIALDREAGDFGGAFSLDVVLAGAEGGTVSVRSSGRPVPGVAVTVTIAGGTFEGGAITIVRSTDSVGDIGLAIFDVTSVVTVSASSSVPTPSQVYRGAPVDPRAARPQTLITSGPVAVTTDSASVELPPPTTTTTTPETTTTQPATTTTVPETTTATEPATTITQPAAITTEPGSTALEVVDTTTAPPPAETPAPPAPSAPPPGESETTTTTATTTTTTTTTTATATTTTTPPATLPPPTLPTTTLPRTGSSDAVAHWATALLVAGVGVVGAVRRNRAFVGKEDRPDGDEQHGFW